MTTLSPTHETRARPFLQGHNSYIISDSFCENILPAFLKESAISSLYEKLEIDSMMLFHK